MQDKYPAYDRESYYMKFPSLFPLWRRIFLGILGPNSNPFKTITVEGQEILGCLGDLVHKLGTWFDWGQHLKKNYFGCQVLWDITKAMWKQCQWASPSSPGSRMPIATALSWNILVQYRKWSWVFPICLYNKPAPVYSVPNSAVGVQQTDGVLPSPALVRWAGQTSKS